MHQHQPKTVISAAFSRVEVSLKIGYFGYQPIFSIQSSVIFTDFRLGSSLAYECFEDGQLSDSGRSHVTGDRK